MTFDDWVRFGIAKKWAGPPVCVTHDGTPTTEDEDAQWEQGDDPCIHVLRLYDSPDTADAVKANFTPYNWRGWEDVELPWGNE